MRRSRATSCRSTSSSSSLAADDRPSRTSQPTSRTKIRYSSRSAAPHDHAPTADSVRSPQLSASVQSSGTPQAPDHRLGVRLRYNRTARARNSSRYFFGDATDDSLQALSDHVWKATGLPGKLTVGVRTFRSCQPYPMHRYGRWNGLRLLTSATARAGGFPCAKAVWISRMASAPAVTPTSPAATTTVRTPALKRPSAKPNSCCRPYCHSAPTLGPSSTTISGGRASSTNSWANTARSTNWIAESAVFSCWFEACTAR
jgi:hypothetical protein